MPKTIRVEREWVPLKQYLPTETYSEVLGLLQRDPAYTGIAQRTAGNETSMNAMLRYIVHSWLKHRAKFEELEGITQYRDDLIAHQRALREVSKEAGNDDQ